MTGTFRDPLVLHVMEALGGGTARHLLDLVRSAEGVRHEVAVPVRRVGALSDDTAVDRLRELGAVVHLVEMRRNPAHPLNSVALVRLRTMIHILEPSVVHGHSSVGGALARLAAARSRSWRVYTPHALARSGLALQVERRLAPLTDRLVAVSAGEAEQIQRLGLAGPGAVIVIPNGLDPHPPAPTIDVRHRLGLAAGTPLVGTVSRLVRQKAPQDFAEACVRAAARLPGTHFVLIGDGPLAGEVDAIVARSDAAARIHRLPHLVEAASAIGQFDLFCLSSRFEGAPYTPLEAMRAGVPVLLSNVVGNRDAIEEGVSGVLVPAGDQESMAAAIVRLMESPARRRELGKAGHARFLERFQLDRMGAAYTSLYRSLCGERA